MPAEGSTSRSTDLARLEPSFHETVWGSADLGPWFPPSRVRIGEVRFETALLPVLVKFLFTSDRLSVQVHPDDAFSFAHEGCCGKTEMWHILRAKPGSCLALGFERPLRKEELDRAARAGDLERLLRWFPARPGETFFVPAGTVHAIGGGIALCEIQQPSAVTYRLYDYGRPRELHLDRALAVADRGVHAGPHPPVRLGDGCELLVSCDYFTTERHVLSVPRRIDAGSRPNLLIGLSGRIAAGGHTLRPGEVWTLAAHAAVDLAPLTPQQGATLLRVC